MVTSIAYSTDSSRQDGEESFFLLLLSETREDRPSIPAIWEAGSFSYLLICLFYGIFGWDSLQKGYSLDEKIELVYLPWAANLFLRLADWSPILSMGMLVH